MKANAVMVAMTVASLLSWKSVSAEEAKPAAPATPPAATPAAPAADASAKPVDVQVLKAVVCQDVKEREPQQELTMAKVGDVIVGWSQVQASDDATITHRWIHEAETAADVPLQVKGGGPYRTWSRKTIGDAGNWKFQVLDPKGTVLKEVAFSASAAPEAAPASSSTAPAEPAAGK